MMQIYQKNATTQADLCAIGFPSPIAMIEFGHHQPYRSSYHEATLQRNGQRWSRPDEAEESAGNADHHQDQNEVEVKRCVAQRGSSG